ncbi:MAG: hypothetical protein IJP63_08140 [Acholeplasmatales bacterium]|nr:hypothetical protein [Acholeplasmatales bacterium]
MNVKKLMDNYIKENPGTSMTRYYKNINDLMGRYIVDRVDADTMKRLLIKLDHTEYETGYAIGNKKLILHADSYRHQKMNLRLHYHITSSTLFNALEGRKVSIEFAIDFCNLNKLKLKDYFNVYSIKKYYSIENKENIKCRIKQLFLYAIDKDIISNNPVPKKYKFLIDSSRRFNYLPERSLKEFVDELFKYKNENGKIMTLIFLLVGLNKDIANELRIKNLDFRHNRISFNNKEYYMSEYISRMLEDYFINEDIENKIARMKVQNYYRTIVYRVRDICGNRNINLETLSYNYQVLNKILNEYVSNDGISYKETCKKENVSINDFKEFLRLKKVFEGGNL